MALFHPLEALEQNRTHQQLKALLRHGLEQHENYWNFGFPLFTKAFPSLRSGTAFVVAPENVGKSMFLINLGCKILEHNPDAYWLDFSLDDSVEDRLGYLLACSGDLPINLMKQAGGAPEEEKQRRKEAFSSFYRRFGNRYLLEGESSLLPEDPDAEGPAYQAERVAQVIEQARAEIGEDKKLFVTVDSFHDLDLAGRAEDENDRLAQKSKLLKRCAHRSNSLIFMTAHTRKDSRRRGLTSDVLKGEGRILYDAKAVLLLYSDLNLNQENATIFWEERLPDGMTEKRPVHEVTIRKNKAGENGILLFYNYEPRRARDFEVDEDTQSWYRSLLFNPR